LSKLLGDLKCLVDTIVASLPNAREGTKTKVNYCYENRSDNIDIVQNLSKCDSKGLLAINIVKLYNNE